MTAFRRSNPLSFDRRLFKTFISISLDSLAHLGDSERKPVPTLLFHGELLSTGSGKGIELGVASRITSFPFGTYPAALLDAVERRIKRALLHREHFLRHLLDALNDPVTVKTSEAERLQ